MALPFALQPRLRVVHARLWTAGPARTIALAFAGSRLLVLAAAVLAETVADRNPALTSGSYAPILRSLTSWDGWWYLGIVRDGYHAAPLVGAYHDYAFFPLYPVLVRALTLPWPAFDALVSVLLSNVLFAAALWLLYRLTADVLDEERALRATVYLAIFPFAWVFSMAYAETLFLVLSLGSLLAAERGHAGRAAILASLAGATRLPGALLLLPLALILWRTAGDRRRLAWLALVPVGAALFALYVTLLTGSWSAYGGAQVAWGRAGVGAAASGGSLATQLDPMRVSFLVTLVAYVFLFVFVRVDRVPIAYTLVAALTILSVFASGNITSIGRLGMVAFPFVWLLAGRGSRAMRWGWPALSAALLLFTAVIDFAGWYQP